MMFRIFFGLVCKKRLDLYSMSYTEVTIKQYVASKDSLESKITAIESLIDALILSTLESIDNNGTFSYSMDDGQMKVTTQYRSTAEVTQGIHALEKIKNIYVNRCNGHLTVLRGRKNYNGC